jgi:hypothetical protein
MRAFSFAVLMLFATAASAQQLDLKSLDKLAEKAKSKTEINLDESMLKSASASLDNRKVEEGVARRTIEKAKGLFLRSFEFDEKNKISKADLKPILDQLKAPNWKLVLRADEDDELTEIWMHNTNGTVDGMILIAMESNELTVINGIGVTDVNELSALGKIDPLK